MNAYRNRVWRSAVKARAAHYVEFLRVFGEEWARLSYYQRQRMLKTL